MAPAFCVHVTSHVHTSARTCIFLNMLMMFLLLGTLKAESRWNCATKCGDLDDANLPRCASWYLAQAVSFVDEEWQELRKLPCSRYITAGTTNATQPCSLPHIRCDSYKRIVSINTTKDLNVQGTLPAELGALSTLTTLDFSGNNLSGTLPEEFGNLRSLQDMRLKKCGLHGDLPATWSQLSKLQLLRISHNPHLVGSLGIWPLPGPLQLWLDNTSIRVPHSTEVYYCLNNKNSMIYTNKSSTSRFEAYTCSGPLATRFVVGTAWGIFFLLLLLSLLLSFILSACCPDRLHTDWLARHNNSQIELLTAGPYKPRDWCFFQWEHLWAALGAGFAILELAGDVSVLVLLAPGLNGARSGLKALVACMMLGLLVPFLVLLCALTNSYINAAHSRPRASHLQLLTSCNPLRTIYFTHWVMALSTSPIFSITTTCALLTYGVFFSSHQQISLGIAGAALSCQLACMLVHICALLEAGLAPEVQKCCGCWAARLHGLGQGLVRGDAWEDRFASSRRPVHQALFVLQARGQV